MTTTVSGQAAKIKALEQQVSELTALSETLSAQLDAKTDEASELKLQLEEAQNASPVKVVAEPERIIEIREVIKYVEKQEKVDQLTQELQTMQQ